MFPRNIYKLPLYFLSIVVHYLETTGVQSPLDVQWISSTGANTYGAHSYEQQQDALGLSCDKETLSEILGGSPHFAKVTALPCGLQYITIHDANGGEVFDDSEYGGYQKEPTSSGPMRMPLTRTARALGNMSLPSGFSASAYLLKVDLIRTDVKKVYEVEGISVDVGYSIDSQLKSVIFMCHVNIPRPFTLSGSGEEEQFHLVESKVLRQLWCSEEGELTARDHQYHRAFSLRRAAGAYSNGIASLTLHFNGNGNPTSMSTDYGCCARDPFVPSRILDMLFQERTKHSTELIVPSDNYAIEFRLGKSPEDVHYDPRKVLELILELSRNNKMVPLDELVIGS